MNYPEAGRAESQPAGQGSQGNSAAAVRTYATGTAGQSTAVFQSGYDTYDYIIVGAGAAGCVLANRLSEDPSVSVLLLEAGPDHQELSTDVEMMRRLKAPELFQEMQDTLVDYRYFTEPQPLLSNRQLFTPRGKIVGGTSIFIAGLFSRGNPADYEEWASLTDEGWRFSEVFPYFLKMENNLREGIDPRFHGHGGPLDVGDIHPLNPATLAFIEACEQVGYPRNPDFNGAQQEGAGAYQVYVKDHVRVNSATAYLTEAVRERQNLHIRTFAHVLRVTIVDRRAVGLEFVDNRDQHSVPKLSLNARKEIILSCGSIDTPKVLMMSGIGPLADLERIGLDKIGVKTQVELNGVGRNLQDHVVVPLIYKYKDGMRSAPPAASGIEGGMFWKSTPDLNSPDLQFVFNHVILGPPGPLEMGGFMLVPVMIDPRSRGSVTLRTYYPRDSPVIFGNLLEDDHDMQILVNGVRRALEIVNAGAFDQFRGDPLLPDTPGKDSSDEQIEAYIRKYVGTLFHPVGTCRMGRDPQDPIEMPVVDSQLRVFGVDGLRIVDASVMPRITSGNTFTPTVMIAEKAADMIKAAQHQEPGPGFPVNVWITVKKDHVEEYKQLVEQLVRKPEPGLLRFEVYADPKDDTRYLWSQRWSSRDAWQKGVDSIVHHTFFIPKIAPLLEEPMLLDRML